MRKSLLVLNTDEVMALWNALQQLVDNTDEECEPRDVKTAEAAQRLIDRIEADLIPAMEGTVG